MQLTPILVLLAVVSSAMAQLTPDRLYYGIDRAIPMTAARPDGAEGSLSIHLYQMDATEVASAEVPEGPVDLAGLFPRLWTNSTPTLLHAQLVVGGEKVGPSVVLQPLVSPEYAYLVDRRSGEPSLFAIQGKTDVLFTQGLQSLRASLQKQSPPYQARYSGLRAYVNKNVLMETTEGEILFRLRPDEAPNTCWNFRELVEGGWYTDIAFHRILPAFVIQGGDPTGIGSGGPGYMFDLEPSRLPHDFGVLSMARSFDPNSNGSQFFVCLTRERTASLDGLYTSFGAAISGADAIMAIAGTPLQNPQSGAPMEAPRIISARLVDAAPFGEGPPRVTRPEPVPTPR